MAGHDDASEGITADGRYVTLGNQDEALADQIICGMDENGDIIGCAEIQPAEFLEQHWYEPFDFDASLFANYGKDWWLGILYKPARAGLLGSTARSNATEAGDVIWEALNFLWNNKRVSYLAMRAMYRVGMGLDEHEAEIENCLSGNPNQLARFKQLNTIIDNQFDQVPENLAKRLAGGAFVGFSLRKIRVPRKYLKGMKAPTRYTTLSGEFGAKMTLNFILAGWGAMMRTYFNMTAIRETRTPYATSWHRGRKPSPLEFIGAAILGDNRVFSLTQNEINDLLEVTAHCEEIPDELQSEIEALSMLLDVFMKFYQERK